jgi:hypothetical protein
VGQRHEALRRSRGCEHLASEHQTTGRDDKEAYAERGAGLLQLVLCERVRVDGRDARDDARKQKSCLSGRQAPRTTGRERSAWCNRLSQKHSTWSRVGSGCEDRLRYGAFILDIDGNNLDAVCQRPE